MSDIHQFLNKSQYQEYKMHKYKETWIEKKTRLKRNTNQQVSEISDHVFIILYLQNTNVVDFSSLARNIYIVKSF